MSTLVHAQAVQVRRAWWGWWVDGRWCPTAKIAMHEISGRVDWWNGRGDRAVRDGLARMSITPSDLALSRTPGAMAVVLTRQLPSRWLIEFEAAPAGWIKADGDPRKRDHRAYYLTDPKGGKRNRVESVTTICDRILPKDGLPPWSERQGIRGALEALRAGLILPDTPDDDAVTIIRKNGLGANAARDDAADRGLNVHALLEQYMTHGLVPNPADHPEPHRPFIQGLVKWLIQASPTPVAVEMLVADPENGYAGRLDLLAYIGRKPKLTLVDLKTQVNGAIYESAHIQVRLYRQAEDRWGEHLIQAAIIVVVDGHGGFREMEVIPDPDLPELALRYYAPVKRLAAACGQVNKLTKKLIDEAAA